MDRAVALRQLPETHATALVLRARGFDNDAIADALAIEPAAVDSLLRIADEKLTVLLLTSRSMAEAEL